MDTNELLEKIGYYWRCGCDEDNVMATWYENVCDRCGFFVSDDSESVNMDEVIKELERDGRLRGSVKEFFKLANN